MNQDFSVWHLVVNASLTVQSVMALLFIFSLSSWFIILQRGAYFRATKRAMLLFENQFWSGVDLSQLFREGTAAAEKGTKFVGMESIFRAGFKEFSRLRRLSVRTQWPARARVSHLAPGRTTDHIGATWAGCS